MYLKGVFSVSGGLSGMCMMVEGSYKEGVWKGPYGCLDGIKDGVLRV